MQHFSKDDLEFITDKLEFKLSEMIPEESTPVFHECKKAINIFLKILGFYNIPPSRRTGNILKHNFTAHFNIKLNSEIKLESSLREEMTTKKKKSSFYCLIA